jgi:hypothetical protein
MVTRRGEDVGDEGAMSNGEGLEVSNLKKLQKKQTESGVAAASPKFMRLLRAPLL